MSKFGDLKGARNRTAETEPETSPADPTPSPAPVKPDKGPGCRGGKKEDPAYSQMTTYVPLELLHKVKGLLNEESLLARKDERKGRDLSELVTELLKGWAGRPNG